MSRLRDRSKPLRGVGLGSAHSGPMAYPDPRLARTNRQMARPMRHRWLRRIGRVIGGLVPMGRVPSLGFSTSGPGRAKYLAVVLSLLLAATALTASLPGGSTGSPTPSASPSQVALGTTSDPTATETPTATPTEDPTPTATPTATPTPDPTPTAKPAAIAKATPRVYSFVALGDSLTSGYNNPGPAWPTRLDGLDARLTAAHNAGIPGDTTAGMLARLDRDVFAYDPGVLFVLGGTNDIGHYYTYATIISNLRAIIVKAQARKIKVFLITVPPNSSTTMRASIDTLNASLQHLANTYKIYLIDIHTPLSSSNGLLQARYTVDGLHFNNAGAQLVAVTIYNRFHRLGY
jgi:lysophospholipase L1-like esterase